jgi:hypothetical protein
MSKQRVRVKVNAASSKGSWSSSVSLDQVGDPDLLTVDGACNCQVPYRTSALETAFIFDYFFIEVIFY